MKFETPIGLGEIVLTHERRRDDRTYQDLLLKVVAVQFELGGKPTYICRVAGTGVTIVCHAEELIGDPAFDQEAGQYSEVEGK